MKGGWRTPVLVGSKGVSGPGTPRHPSRNMWTFPDRPRPVPSDRLQKLWGDAPPSGAGLLTQESAHPTDQIHALPEDLPCIRLDS